MPLKSWKSQKTVSKNITKLMNEKPWKTRAKAINTIAKKEGITKAKAKQKQAVVIALSKAWKSKKK